MVCRFFVNGAKQWMLNWMNPNWLLGRRPPLADNTSVLRGSVFRIIAVTWVGK